MEKIQEEGTKERRGSDVPTDFEKPLNEEFTYLFSFLNRICD
jgi:hypothetical protein